MPVPRASLGAAVSAVRRPRSARLSALLVAVAVALLLGAAVVPPRAEVLRRRGVQGSAPVQPNDAAEEAAQPVATVLRYLRDAVSPLEKQVEAGNVVPKFGEKAHGVLSNIVGRAGDAARELELAADGMLQALFLKQLVILRQQLIAKFDNAGKPAEAISQADNQFVAAAEELVRPASDWSYEQERYALQAALQGTYRREARLQEEKIKASQTQEATVEIISKLHAQIEALQQKVAAMRAGSPWFLSSSYRIPGTPFQLVGRYSQGRGTVELSLNPDKDPAKAAAGFVDGLGPANLGVNFNLGL